MAISNSDAIARGSRWGRADSRSYSTALSDHGLAISNSRALSDGMFGGRATSISESLADAWRGVSVSNVEAVSGATLFGRAVSDGVGVSISGPGRHSRADVYAESSASRFGRSRAQSMMVEVRR